MIKNSKFVKTAIAAAALGLVTLSLQAATLATNSTTFATQVFAGTTPSAAVTTAVINVNTAANLNAGSSVTVMVQLTGGKYATALGALGAASVTSAAVAAQNIAGIVALGGTVTYGSTASGATAATGGTGTATATTNNADVLVVTLVTDTAISVGGRLLSVTIPISAAGLATAGATVTSNASVYTGAVAAKFGTALPTTGTFEASTEVTTVATSANGLIATAGAASTAQRLDLNATVASSLFTAGTAGATATGATNSVQIGTLAINTPTAATMTAAGIGNPYTVGAKTSTLTFTAPAGYWGGLGTTGVVEVRANNATACGGAVVAANSSVPFATAALAAAATTVSTVAAVLPIAATAAPHHICITAIPGTVAFQTGAATLTGTLGVAAAQDAAVAVSSTAMTSLATNGSQVDVNAYWPASLAASGYAGYVRVINTGTLAAPISMAYINPTTGVVGTAAVVIASLPAGASQMVSSSVIEAAVGASPFGTSAGRVRVTAPTNALRTQSFIQVGNNAPQETSGAQ